MLILRYEWDVVKGRRPVRHLTRTITTKGTKGHEGSAGRDYAGFLYLIDVMLFAFQSGLFARGPCWHFSWDVVKGRRPVKHLTRADHH